MGAFNINGVGHNHLSMKLVCFALFCFVAMRSAELGCFRWRSWYLRKALDVDRCMGVFPLCLLDLRCKSS
jgi:hypothetical protein